MTVHAPQSETIKTDPSPGELSDNQLAAIRLFELPDDIFDAELPEFVRAQTEALSEGTSRNVISDDTPSFSGFIAPDRPLFAAEGFIDQQPFVLDDPIAYEMSISRIRFEYKKIAHKFDPAKALLNAAVRGSSDAQILYFGSYYGVDQRLDRIEHGKESAVPGSTSVTVIGDAAKCMERGAIVHNSMLMVGVGSEYCVGGLKKFDNDGAKVAGEGHVFLKLKGSSGRDIIYDPANPKITEYPDRGEMMARPNTFPLDDGRANSFSVDWVRTVITDGKIETIPDGTWTYYKNTPGSVLGRMALL